MRIGAVIAGAGWGTLRTVNGVPFPKACERVSGKPMIAHTVDLVVALNLDPIVVVVNPEHGRRVQDALYHHTYLSYEVQPERKGPPDTVLRALPLLRSAGVDDFLVAYVDMPLWTLDTMERLVETHTREQPALTMLTVPLTDRTPEMIRQYGIVRHTDTGGVAGTVEMDEATDEEITEADTVNPSLWVWHGVDWLEKIIPELPLHDKGDGFPPEHHFPDLVGIAAREGRRIVEVSLDDPTEAMGVNTMEHLHTVRRVFADRMQ